MEYKELNCREHNGTFKIPVKAGRPPTRCKEDNLCDQAPGYRPRTSRTAGQRPKRASNPQGAAKLTAERHGTPPRMAAERPARASGGRVPSKVAQAARETAPVKGTKGKVKVKKSKTERVVKESTPKPTLRGVNRTALRTGTWCKCDEQGGERHEKGIEGCRYATRKAPVVVTNNPCVPRVYDARRILEPQGWKLTGKKYKEGDDFYGSLIGQRGDETIALTWKNGKIHEQHYAMFQTDKPSMTGMPRRRLDFEPDELSDVALVKKLSGRKVTFWNQLGKRQETIVMPGKSTSRIKVEHLMTGKGDEERRLVSFVDQTPQHMAFRAFAVDSLIKIS